MAVIETPRTSHSQHNDAVIVQDATLKIPRRGTEPLTILDDVSLRVPSGEATGIIGPSGSGKTSLMMLMGGLERPTSGRIVVDGTDIGQLSENDRARFRQARIGIVFQSFHLLPTMTALQNVMVPLELAGIDRAADRAHAALVSVGLDQRATHRPAELSGGEQQRVALARAVVTQPRLILADEPTGNLDPETGAHVMALLFDLRAKLGTTLVLVTHDMNLAARCDRRLTMRAGRLA
ncbi:cell division ATP-binding protein FtsE [Neoasaia chiangmaiensis NBRC 101099]|uniref:Uncharacterized protein n=1 Tax=Neoasaia chiangmaiensis TaxID=320497 RepID=A0A1U9KS25_9PROT|nr:ABC transporter ATP-binding protein [Neoasaia chiangmaiensis]AQS88641.1 hypothetical protein A0U93_12710 [Neoasaia chiangmaiensis]GBR41196.1 cell division ATP-binding protein FtsE [Neoasaia chiangmaiensis NBRC 101099]GEN13573.1 ABC transporter [Neoasaia chiangmaiensis]